MGALNSNRGRRFLYLCAKMLAKLPKKCWISSTLRC